MSDNLKRCTWCGTDPLYLAYHDSEWGVPEWDDRALFEKLILDGFQAGLAWITILRKRENFQRAFDGFEPAVIARYDEAKCAALMADAGIVRNRQKIAASVSNAQVWLDIMAKEGSFSDYLWRFVGAGPIVNRRGSEAPVPAESAESKAMSKDLKARGFRFCGPTICYAFMQAVGIVNDHSLDCFRHGQV